MRPSSHRFDRSATARIVVAGLVLIEAALLVTAAGWLGVAVARGDAEPGPSVVLVVLCVALALALGAAARALLRAGGGGRAGRGFLVTWQLLQAATAITLLGAPAARVGAVAALALSAGVLAGIAAAGPPRAPEPVTPEPVTPEPVTPEPVTPDR